MWHSVPLARQRRPIVGVLRMCWLLPGPFDCFCCPFYVVCKCGLGCCVCGGCRVGLGAWGRGPVVVLHVCALFVGGGGCAGCWAGVGACGGWCGCPPLLLWYTTLLCSVVLCAACCHVLASFCVPLPALACCAALCVMLPLRCVLRCLCEAWQPRLPGQGRYPRRGRVRVTSEALG